MMNLVRTFIAIKIPIEAPLLDVWGELRGKFPANEIKWVAADSLHLTLFFMGDTPVDHIPMIGNDLKSTLAAHHPFEIEVKGLGYFGNPSNPKVIWVGIERCMQLTKIKRDVVQVISSYGFSDDQRAFNPHLTLGRVRGIHEPLMLQRLIHGYSDFVFHRVSVQSVIHFRSELRPTGPIYTPINEFPLGVG
ncbi:MAG TPA: RNA 2',3'-cyclic phosphodiesterase [Tenuifilaceae bacterium]|nr:RNA 2',3'-cyclic phosphodiesterase [Tenuifilaceae bacterium]